MKKALICILSAVVIAACYARGEGGYQPSRQARDLNNKAVRALNEKSFENALVLIDRVIALEPEFDGAYANKAAILSALARHEEAAATLATLLERRPDYVEAYVPLGLLRERLGDAQEAKSLYLKAVELYDVRIRKAAAQGRAPEPDQAVARAVAVYLGQDARQALLALKDVLAEHPDHTVARELKRRIEAGDRAAFVAGLTEPARS